MYGGDKRFLPLVIINFPVGQTTETHGFGISANTLSDMTFSKSQLKGTRKVIMLTLDNNIETRAFIICGASEFAFISKNFVKMQNHPLQKLKMPRIVNIIYEREIEDMDIEHVVRIPFKINNHSEELSAFATKLGQYPLV